MHEAKRQKQREDKTVFQVTDYANRLDFEETTRNYINSAASSYSGSAYSSILQRPSEFVRRRGYDISSSPATTTYSRPWSSDYASIDGLYSYKHYRKSNATLKDRNSRAMSPIMGRELDRYYKTERRSDYMGDMSSGGSRDFRYYNYRTVPYFGGSDHYAYVPRAIRFWTGDRFWALSSSSSSARRGSVRRVSAAVADFEE